MAKFWFEHPTVEHFYYCRGRIESKTLTSFGMCLNKALQAMHIVHIKPTWRVAWCGIGRQDLKDSGRGLLLQWKDSATFDSTNQVLQQECVWLQDMMEALTTQNSELRTMLIKATEVKPRSEDNGSQDGDKSQTDDLVSGQEQAHNNVDNDIERRTAGVLPTTNCAVICIQQVCFMARKHCMNESHETC